MEASQYCLARQPTRPDPPTRPETPRAGSKSTLIAKIFPDVISGLHIIIDLRSQLQRSDYDYRALCRSAHAPWTPHATLIAYKCACQTFYGCFPSPDGVFICRGDCLHTNHAQWLVRKRFLTIKIYKSANANIFVDISMSSCFSE